MMAVCPAGIDPSKSRSVVGVPMSATIWLSRSESSTVSFHQPFAAADRSNLFCQQRLPIRSFRGGGPVDKLVYMYDRLTAVLSRKSKYGLKALLVLAQKGGTEPVLISELADRDAIPKKFLEAILLELKRHGVVQSKKGKGGGYFLRRKPAEITFGEVIRVLDGPLAAVPCVSQMAYMKCTECVDEPTCGVRGRCERTRRAETSPVVR
jgi:Rrf2 family protein